jgi:ferritin-like metal-binding protein YciE
MKSDILEELLHHELRSLYSAEKQLFKASKKMARAACHPKLQAVFQTRLQETSGQLHRLEQIAALMDKRLLDSPPCKGMARLIEESERLLHEHAGDEPSDVTLIAAAQHAGCYEIEGYTIARTLASRLGLDQIERLLQQNLNEEKATAARLARLAKYLTHGRAASQPAQGDAPRTLSKKAAMDACLVS